MAAVLVLPVSPWKAWSLPGLAAPFGHGTSWAAPSPSKKHLVARGAWLAPHQSPPHSPDAALGWCSPVTLLAGCL